MKTIWKFQLDSKPKQIVEMPKGANILCVQGQGALGIPTVWAEVDPAAPKVGRAFYIAVMGGALPAEPEIPLPGEPRLRYIGTFQTAGGLFVGHVYTDDFEYPATGYEPEETPAN